MTGLDTECRIGNHLFSKIKMFSNCNERLLALWQRIHIGDDQLTYHSRLKPNAGWTLPTTLDSIIMRFFQRRLNLCHLKIVK